MNSELEQQQVLQAISSLRDALEKLEKIVTSMKPEKLKAFAIEKYFSNSGNVTWRLSCRDNETVYLRQKHQDDYKRIGIWRILNSLEFNQSHPCDIDLLCLKEGDFWLVREITSFKVFDFDSNLLISDDTDSDYD